MPLRGRIVPLTGASRRIAIGAGVARRLVADGAAVLLQSWSPHDAEQLWSADPSGAAASAEKLRDRGWAGQHVSADLANPDTPVRLVDVAAAHPQRAPRVRRRARAPTDCLLVATGASAPLNLVCTHDTRAGQHVLVEDRTHDLTRRLFVDHGLVPLPIASVGDDLDLKVPGVDAENLVRQQRPPAFHNPPDVSCPRRSARPAEPGGTARSHDRRGRITFPPEAEPSAA